MYMIVVFYFKIYLHNIENNLSISLLFVLIDILSMVLSLIIVSQKQSARVQVEAKSITFVLIIYIKVNIFYK